jgi:hypothetical protein
MDKTYTATVLVKLKGKICRVLCNDGFRGPRELYVHTHSLTPILRAGDVIEYKISSRGMCIATNLML